MGKEGGESMEEKVVLHQKGKDDMYKNWHASEYHLFLYVHKGKGSLVCGEKVFPLEEGVLVFIGADVYHYTMPEVPAEYERSKLLISPKRMQALMSILPQKTHLHKSVVYAPIPQNKRTSAEEIFYRGAKPEGNRELGVLIISLELLSFLQTYEAASASGAEGRMARAIRYINENVSQELDIQQICDTVSISKYHFCRQFKEHTGLTVMQYILKTRIVLAREELKKSKLSISEISEKYGFSSVSYFCRVFKEEENCSPLQYRKQNSP